MEKLILIYIGHTMGACGLPDMQTTCAYGITITRNTPRGGHQSPKPWHITDIPQPAMVISEYTTVARLYTTVALYGLSVFNVIMKCIINQVRDIYVFACGFRL